MEGFATANEGVETVTIMNLVMYGVKSCTSVIREMQAVVVALGVTETCIMPREININDA